MSRLTGEWQIAGMIRASRGMMGLALLALAALLAGCTSRETKGAEKLKANESTAPKTFASPEAAGTALFDAAQGGNRDEILAIFGSEGKEILLSGDAVKDKNTLERFVTKYKEMHRWSKNNAGSEILYIGADNLAVPVPLKQNASSQWAFDIEAGKDEILARRIGDGELTTIGVLTEVAGAQDEYFSAKHEYAQKFVSDEGQHNGLYWPAAEGERSSPLGPLGDVAKALGYTNDKSQPFGGYYYRMLTQQGGTAKGGAKDYKSDGKLTSGYAVLAYPARYGNSGIMTFLVGTDGVVYQKDLGDKTSELAAAIKEYNPGDGWTVVVAPEANPIPGTKAARKK